MDQRLVAWARAVKARRRQKLPTLWLFTDPNRPRDALLAARHLPPGLCGIVFRPDATPNGLTLARGLARLCRARHLALTIAGDWRLAAAAGTGQHLRLARKERARLTARPITASAHNLREARASARAGATLIFLSPAFPTPTHPGAPALGPIRFAAIARRCALPVLALGGIDGHAARRLSGTGCAGAGAIRALNPGDLAARTAAAR
jgi:thiamine-phosphate pyrophosphorylase